MEMIVDIYAQPYDSKYPEICMDEQPVQFQAQVRVPIPATAQHPKRVDYEHEGRGTASIFMFTEPLISWRQATARSQRTKSDWAQEVGNLLLMSRVCKVVCVEKFKVGRVTVMLNRKVLIGNLRLAI